MCFHLARAKRLQLSAWRSKAKQHNLLMPLPSLSNLYRALSSWLSFAAAHGRGGAPEEANARPGWGGDPAGPLRGGGPRPRHRRDRLRHGRALPPRRERRPQRPQIRRLPQVRPLPRPQARRDDRRRSRVRPRRAPSQASRQARPHRLRHRRRRRHVQAPPLPPHRHHREYLRLLPWRTRFRFRVQYSVLHRLRAHQHESHPS